MPWAIVGPAAGSMVSENWCLRRNIAILVTKLKYTVCSMLDRYFDKTLVAMHIVVQQVRLL